MSRETRHSASRVPPVIWDYKTTSTAATPESWGRKLLPGYLMQAGLYTRGIKRALGWKECEMRFIVQETAPPYALGRLFLGR